MKTYILNRTMYKLAENTKRVLAVNTDGTTSRSHWSWDEFQNFVKNGSAVLLAD